MRARRGLLSPGPWVVSLVALVLTTGIVGTALAAFQWDASIFVGFGEEAATREYAEEHLGEVRLRGTLGHDGRFFFIQSNDPWLTDPADNAELLDFPVYRSQRMLYPLLASGFGLLGPHVIVWSMLLVNVVGLAAGTLGTARLSQRLGGSSWWGLAFLGNLGLLFTLTIDTAGIVAAACAIWAVALLYEDRLASAIGLLAAAALTREVMLLCAVGAAIWLWTQRRRREALASLVVPTTVLAAWEIYIRLRLGPDDPGVDAISLPFVGLVRAFPGWFADPMVLASGLLVVALSLVYVVRWWESRSLLGWAFLGFVPLAMVMSEKVWREHFDFTRAVAPLMTATILLVFVESRQLRIGSGKSADRLVTSTAGGE